MAVLEALYVFLKSWYTYASTNFEMILPCGGKWIPLDDIVIMQLSLRGLEAESLFNEFKQVLQAFNISRSETETLINTIEASYSKELENLLRKRLSKLSESESELLEFFASYYFYVEEGRNYLYYSIFDKLKNILGEDANKLYNILVGKGLVIIHGYRSITDKRVIDHIGVYVPPWSRKYLKEKFDEYLAKQELKSKEIIQKLEEKKTCPVCGKNIVEDEEHTSVYGFNLHWKCYEKWKRKVKNILPSLPETFSKEEKILIAEFQALEVIKGQYLYEQTVSEGKGTHPYIGKKRIDLVIKTKEADWVIEAEKELNYQALGQILVYSTLWQALNPKRQIVNAILVETVLGKDILKTAKT